MSKTKSRIHPQLELYLLLKSLAECQRWIIPNQQTLVPPLPGCNIRPDQAYGVYGVSDKGERLLKSWQRRGLQTRWGMHKRSHKHIFQGDEIRSYHQHSTNQNQNGAHVG
jgi:hypothetical protein